MMLLQTFVPSKDSTQPLHLLKAKGPDPEVIKLFFFCSTQISMKFSLLINMKMPIIIGFFIFISRKKNHARLCSARKNLQLLVTDMLSSEK